MLGGDGPLEKLGEPCQGSLETCHPSPSLLGTPREFHHYHTEGNGGCHSLPVCELVVCVLLMAVPTTDHSRRRCNGNGEVSCGAADEDERLGKIRKMVNVMVFTLLGMRILCLFFDNLVPIQYIRARVPFLMLCRFFSPLRRCDRRRIDDSFFMKDF